jgi:glycosyltransferase involved in cell wall biosynthesis
MRLGIVPELAEPHGGVYQYSLSLLDALRVLYPPQGGDRVVVFTSDTKALDRALPRAPNWTIHPPDPPDWRDSVRSALRRIAGDGPLRQLWWRLKPHVVNDTIPLNVEVVPANLRLARWYRRAQVQLMLYPDADTRAFEAGIPYVMAIHDVAHRRQPEFPEFSEGSSWEWAEHAWRNGARHATLLLADSEVGREDLLEAYGRYGVTADRIRLVPFVPPPYLRPTVSPAEQQTVRARFRLPQRYLFYPADIAPHKNQFQIVRALGQLRQEQGTTIPMVFCGFCFGDVRRRHFADMQAFIRRQGLRASVRFLGHVPDADMSALYAGAAGLVMPTLVGPTVIPVYEAWACGCPVITSNIRGIREQAGDAALLVDPRSVDEIAAAIYRLWTDAALRESLAARGKERLSRYTFDDFCARLGAALDDAKTLVRARATRAP